MTNRPAPTTRPPRRGRPTRRPVARGVPSDVAPGVTAEHTAGYDPTDGATPRPPRPPWPPHPAESEEPEPVDTWSSIPDAAPALDPTGPTVVPAPQQTSAGNTPQDLAILEQVPLLGGLLAELRAVDRMLANVLDTLTVLQDTGVVEAATGLDIDRWLSIVARRTGTDIRMLHTAVAVARRIPALSNAFRTATISWAQMRTCVLVIHRLPRGFDDAIDHTLGTVLQRATATDPDDLIHVIRQAVDSVTRPDRTGDGPADTSRDEFLALQPRLDGTGGLIHGDAGPLTFATIDAALSPTRADLDGRTIGRHRIDRLVELCDDALDGPTATARDGHPAPGPSTVTSADGSMRSRPQLLLRVELDALLDRTTMPARLLTTLLGGTVHLDATTTRQLLDRRGADLRTVIIDHGRTVGVGRRTRVPPGWLTDATLAVHDTCTAPGCARGARICDTDHARPWHPPRAGAPPGRTDLGQLAPVCGPDNRAKEADGWKVHQHPDGTRRWHHPRTGLTTTTLPATWQPPSTTTPVASNPEPR